MIVPLSIRFARLLAPLAWLLLCVAALQVQAAPLPGGAEIVSVQGKGETLGVKERTWREAVVNQQLAAGASVRTLDSSRMSVLLADQTQVRLAANSMIEIKQVSDGAARATQLQQNSGRSWTQSKNVPDKLTVQTPSALAAIRGTDWELVVDEDGTSTLTVLSGQVLLSNEAGSVNIDAGEQGRAQKGVAPVKTVLVRPRDRVQWVSSFVVNIQRYPDLAGMPDVIAPFATGDLATARRTVQQLALSAVAPASAALLLSDFLVQEGDFDAAISALVQGARKYPTEERFDIWRARLLLARDEIPAAREALMAARGGKPPSTELMLAEGELERLEGNATAATAAYRGAIAGDPAAARAWHGLGVIQTEREDVAQARSSLTHALSLDPQGGGFLAELGTLEAFSDRLDAARSAFQQALTDRPDDFVALTGLALVELKAGNTETATQQLLAATLIEPRYARAQTLLAVAYYQQGRTRDALFALARARALDPKDPLPDLYQSVIHNDLLQPGDALITARQGLALLPYLKSLNQVANDQKGGANLGSALAAFGLEDWARSYAQDSYTPFWAGSHLFLVDLYHGDFNKKSELFQGFLSDPTVFGASNRFSQLVSKPGHYGALSLHANSSSESRLMEQRISMNGYSNSVVPFAYFADVSGQRQDFGTLDFDGRAATRFVGLGVRPSHALGLFAYANSFDATFALSPTDAVVQRVTGRNDRLDIGGNYRFGPQAQAWFKVGRGQESSAVEQVTTAQTNFGAATNGSTFETRPQQRDVQWRHAFAPSDTHELSWGLEEGRMNKSNTLVQENFFHIGEGTVPSDHLTQQDDDHSRDIWVSNRIRATSRINLTADLAFQRYRKTRDINILRDREPPVKQVFAEVYDREILAPRLGASYVLGNGATLRTAWQKWLHPASYSTLATVATAGIPIDDTLLNPGGLLTRTRAQIDWEMSPTLFLNVFADHKSAENLNSPLDGVLNTRANIPKLESLRSDPFNLSAPDTLEAKPMFSRGEVRSLGFTFNQVLSRTLAGYLGYANTRSENMGDTHAGNSLPYLPEHRAVAGLTWVAEQGLAVSALVVWRSDRFQDEANLIPWSAGWDGTLKVHWESAGKRWAVDGYASNLFREDLQRLVGVKLVARF